MCFEELTLPDLMLANPRHNDLTNNIISFAVLKMMICFYQYNVINLSKCRLNCSRTGQHGRGKKSYVYSLKTVQNPSPICKNQTIMSFGRYQDNLVQTLADVKITKSLYN